MVFYIKNIKEIIQKYEYITDDTTRKTKIDNDIRNIKYNIFEDKELQIVKLHSKSRRSNSSKSNSSKSNSSKSNSSKSNSSKSNSSKSNSSKSNSKK
jgi:hypothetical protein